MTRPFVPQTVVDLAHARRDARLRHEWTEADGFRAEIEAAGWLVIDRGVDFDLRPARPADVVADGQIRYGASESVPSRLDEPEAAPATVVVVAAAIEDLAAAAAVVAARAGLASVVLVANGLTADTDGELGRIGDVQGIEVVQLAAAGSVATARNAGIRRATGTVIVLLDRPSAADPAIIRELVDALTDPTVAIAGTIGRVSSGLPRFDGSTAREVDAVTGTIAFRRADYVARGPLEERFQGVGELDAWWSLVLRDNDDERPGRALRVGAGTGDGVGLVDSPRAADAPGQRRDRYRVLDRFGSRTDLISGGSSGAKRA